ncbi:MAG: MFS transporter, partial [Vitreimonas sp.]
MDTGQQSRTKRPLALIPELGVYYLIVAFYFFAFGMQFALYPSLTAFYLHATPEGVGLAQSALSAPMFCLLLFGGLLAERARAGITLAWLQFLLAAASVFLAVIVFNGWLSYEILIAYAVFVGACAAFTMPVRDAALNGVIGREALLGRHTPIATAAAVTTAVQIGAQIAGILAARGGGDNPAPFLVGQAVVLCLAAVVSLGLQAPKLTGHERTILGALRDMRDGLNYCFRSPVMAPMLISAAYVGVFVIGSFQVLFPLIVREAYGGAAHIQGDRLQDMQGEQLGALFACFWGASFVSAAALSRLKPLRHPGRALVISHLVGAAVLFTFAVHKPFLTFALLVAVWGLAAGVSIS